MMAETSEFALEIEKMAIILELDFQRNPTSTSYLFIFIVLLYGPHKTIK